MQGNWCRLVLFGRVDVIPKQIDLIIASVWYDRTLSHMALTRLGPSILARSVTSDGGELIHRWIRRPIHVDQCYVNSTSRPVRNRLKSTTVKRALFGMTDRRADVITIIDRFECFHNFLAQLPIADAISLYLFEEKNLRRMKKWTFVQIADDDTPFYLVSTYFRFWPSVQMGHFLMHREAVAMYLNHVQWV